MAKKHTPQDRFDQVRKYFQRRGIYRYNEVMSAIDPDLGEYSDAIRSAWNNRFKITDNDLPIIEKMERVVEHIKAA